MKGWTMQDDFGNEIPTLSQMWERITNFNDELSTVKEQLAENTEATKRIETNTGELIEILNSFKGAFKVFGWIGNLAKPLAAIIGLFMAIYAAWHAVKTGVMPK